MKKAIIITTLVLLIAFAASGCSVKLSDDDYKVLNIFTSSRIYTYERTEDEAVTDVVYNINVDRNKVMTNVEINFEAGQFRSESEFYADTLIPISA